MIFMEYLGFKGTVKINNRGVYYGQWVHKNNSIPYHGETLSKLKRNFESKIHYSYPEPEDGSSHKAKVYVKHGGFKGRIDSDGISFYGVCDIDSNNTWNFAGDSLLSIEENFMNIVDKELKGFEEQLKYKGFYGGNVSFSEEHGVYQGRVINIDGYEYFQGATLEELEIDFREVVDKLLKPYKPKSTEIDERPDWDNYFLDMLPSISRRSTCDRGKTSCLITKDNRIIASGYAGSPPGLAHCDQEGHLIKKVLQDDGSIKEHCVRTIHSEQNALMTCSKYGIATDGATIYVSMTPCAICTRLLIVAGIKRVVCEKRYHADAESVEMFENVGIELVIKNNEVTQYGKEDK